MCHEVKEQDFTTSNIGLIYRSRYSLNNPKIITFWVRPSTRFLTPPPPPPLNFIQTINFKLFCIISGLG